MSVETKVWPRQDPRLDWIGQYDDRSRDYPVRAVLRETVPEKPRSWGLGPVLDQGREGACVGFGWTAETIASPRPDPEVTAEIANQFARIVYRRAQAIDEWEGEDYEGTSVLAGAKVMQEHGYIGSYRWAFDIEDIRGAVTELGPVVIGIPWYSGMYQTRPSGLVEVDGQIVGGHCILLTGYHPGMRIRGEDWDARFRVFRWRNSWGENYGVGGSGFIRYEDLRDLLADFGEACVPLERSKVRIGG